MPQKVLLLHGSRQTGQLLLGRMDKLRKKLQAMDLVLVAPDALFEHVEDSAMRQWWNRDGNEYAGLERTMQHIESLWNSTCVNEACRRTEDAAATPRGESPSSSSFVGIIGFSMGARLAHLLTVAHAHNPQSFLRGLSFVIMVAGYEAPLPDGAWRKLLASDMTQSCVAGVHEACIMTPSLHVWGETDRIIERAQSQSVTKYYRQPETFEHSGGHHVPMQAEAVRTYVNFIDRCLAETANGGNQLSSRPMQRPTQVAAVPSVSSQQVMDEPEPDDDTKQAQMDEFDALTAIFPEEVTLQSPILQDGRYQTPIQYTVDLVPSDVGVWPLRPVKLQVTYPYNYPETALPKLKLLHDMNVMEFTSAAASACIQSMEDAARAEQGMPCIMSCIYAARDFFESGSMHPYERAPVRNSEEHAPPGPLEDISTTPEHQPVKPASPERLEECIQRGLNIAENLLRLNKPNKPTNGPMKEPEVLTGRGGSWVYTIGLVGKPSAGKSTFFNAATAFARQRDDSDNALGGAAMAPHPFTTIDPNTGCALVPAPPGSCPEDEAYSLDLAIGNSHGRDTHGRRLIPVLLKDVAGLVPGAYQGRGRGNKFLNDLCDADVLVHVTDASGTADTEGNTVGLKEDGLTPCSGASNPLQDLAWIRKELIEWVYTNLMVKWDTIKRRGRSKLESMFNGYGQKAAVTWSILNAVEKEMEDFEQREKALDHLDDWDEGDIHLLVSAFLGVRFPMALALNKCDLPSSQVYSREILDALPAHGAHVGVPLCARNEMSFVKHAIETAMGQKQLSNGSFKSANPPIGVWTCLQMALTLKEPVLVFPVADFNTLSPLPGMSEQALSAASLPTIGMIACLQQAGGTAPSLWDASSNTYTMSQKKDGSVALRDVLIMKPGSTIEDVFLALKRLGAIGGEFIRAEACGSINAAPKPVPKHEVVSRSTRIVKIMTSKRTSWQSSYR